MQVNKAKSAKGMGLQATTTKKKQILQFKISNLVYKLTIKLVILMCDTRIEYFKL